MSRIGNTVLGCNLKNDRMISVCFQGKPFNITVIQIYAPTSNAEEAEVGRLWRPTRPFRTNTPKRCPFHYRELECKSRKSRDTWANKQIWPWGTKWTRLTGQRLIEFCQENTLAIANTFFQQHKRRLYTWTSPDGRYWNQIYYFFAAKDGEILYSQQKQDWSLDHELLIAKYRLKFKKVGKTIRSFRYDLNQIPTIIQWKWEIDSRDLIWLTECLKNYGRRFVTLYRRLWSRPSPRKRNAKRQNGCLRRPYK